MGDLDGDGDLDTLVTNSNQPSKVWINSERCSADINADGVVNGEDLTILLADWGGGWLAGPNVNFYTYFQ